MRAYYFTSPSRPVPLAQAADGLAAKTSAKAGKTVPYDEYEPCPVSLLRFWIQLRLRCVGLAAVVHRRAGGNAGDGAAVPVSRVCV